MKENLIVFTNYSNQIPIMLGMFGKKNVDYLYINEIILSI